MSKPLRRAAQLQRRLILRKAAQFEFLTQLKAMIQSTVQDSAIKPNFVKFCTFLLIREI